MKLMKLICGLGLALSFAAAQADEPDVDAEAPDHTPAEKDAAPDSTLDETKRVLLDYIGLLQARRTPTLARHVHTQADN